jgi:hypothetical protein
VAARRRERQAARLDRLQRSGRLRADKRGRERWAARTHGGDVADREPELRRRPVGDDLDHGHRVGRRRDALGDVLELVLTVARRRERRARRAGLARRDDRQQAAVRGVRRRRRNSAPP